MIEQEQAEGLSSLTWVARLPFVRDPVFIKQMTLVLVIPLVFLGLLLVVIDWPPDAERLAMTGKIVLLTGAIVLVLYLFVVFGVLRGRQELRYTLDDKGACEETAGPLKHMNLVKWLLMLSGKPTYVGIGMITRGPSSERVTWRRVEKSIPDPQTKTITLRKGRTDLMVLRCTDETYEQALSWVGAHVGTEGG